MILDEFFTSLFRDILELQEAVCGRTTISQRVEVNTGSPAPERAHVITTTSRCPLRGLGHHLVPTSDRDPLSASKQVTVVLSGIPHLSTAAGYGKPTLIPKLSSVNEARILPLTYPHDSHFTDKETEAHRPKVFRIQVCLDSNHTALLHFSHKGSGKTQTASDPRSQQEQSPPHHQCRTLCLLMCLNAAVPTVQ